MNWHIDRQIAEQLDARCSDLGLVPSRVVEKALRLMLHYDGREEHMERDPNALPEEPAAFPDGTALPVEEPGDSETAATESGTSAAEPPTETPADSPASEPE